MIAPAKRRAFTIVSHDEAVRLRDAMLAGDMDAKARLIESVLPFAFKVAKKLRAPGIDRQEMYSEAKLHAVRAVADWNPEKGALTTIVGCYVWSRLNLYVNDHGHRGIYLPPATRKAVVQDARPQGELRRRSFAFAVSAYRMAKFSELSHDDRRGFDFSLAREESADETKASIGDMIELFSQHATETAQAILAEKLNGIEKHDREPDCTEIAKTLGITPEVCRLQWRRAVATIKKIVATGSSSSAAQPQLAHA